MSSLSTLHSFPPTLQQRNLDLLSWQNHSEKSLVQCLHRLRNGHNRLNHRMSPIDPEIDPKCPWLSYIVPENSHYILIDCPKHENRRIGAKALLAKLQIPFTLKNLTEFNQAITAHNQFAIRNHLIAFLRRAKILHRI